MKRSQLGRSLLPAAPYWCVLVAFLFAVVTSAIVKAEGKREVPTCAQGSSNSDP